MTRAPLLWDAIKFDTGGHPVVPVTIDQFADDITEQEFFLLWQRRYLKGDGRFRAPVMRTINALSIIRSGRADWLAKYDSDRKD
jgi:hypothetical protein